MVFSTAGMPPMSAAPGELRAGRWQLDPHRSRLLLETKVCGMVGVRGSFTGFAGHLDLMPGLALVETRAASDGIRLRAEGRISREDAGYLLTKAGTERMIGSQVRLDLTVTFVPPSVPARRT